MGIYVLFRMLILNDSRVLCFCRNMRPSLIPIWLPREVMFTKPALGGLETKNWAVRGSEAILGVRETH